MTSLTAYSVTDALGFADITETGLSLRPGVTLEQVETLAVALSRRQSVGKFYLGDLFLALDSYEFGSQAIESTGLDYSTVSQYRWVASKIPPDLRDPSLPYSYHRAVAALSHERQAYALQLAVEESLSWVQFQTLVSEIKGVTPREPRPPKAIGAAIDHSNDAVGRLWTQSDADTVRDYLT